MSVLNLTAEQRKIISSERLDGKMSPLELEILKMVREINYGQLVIHIHDNVPIRYTIQSEKYIIPTEESLSKIIKHGK